MQDPEEKVTGTLKNLSLFRVTTNSDLTEGRGRTVEIGWFVDEAIARKAASGQGVMGTDATVEPLRRTVVTVGDKTYLLGEQVSLQYEDPREVRARGLAKLTQAEKEALGLAPKTSRW